MVSSRRRSRRRWIWAPVLTLLALSGGASTAAAQCGQEFHERPAQGTTPGGPPLAIGDSVLADALPPLVRDGFEADGMVCRQMGQGLEILQARRAHLPHLVVLALGTNGEVTPQQIDTALAIIGPQRILALVTPHGSVVPSTPQVIRKAAESHPGRILLLDWDRLAAGHKDWFAPDGVHLGGSAGIEAFAQLIASLLPYATAASTPSGTATPEAATPTREPGAPTTEPGTPTTLQLPAAHPKRAKHDQRAPGSVPPRTTTPPKLPSAAGSTSPAPPLPPATPAPAPARASHRASSGISPLAIGILVGVVVIAVAAAVWRLKHR